MSLESELNNFVTNLLRTHDPLEVHGALIEEMMRVSVICEPLISHLIVGDLTDRYEQDSPQQRHTGQASIFDI